MEQKYALAGVGTGYSGGGEGVHVQDRARGTHPPQQERGARELDRGAREHKN